MKQLHLCETIYKPHCLDRRESLVWASDNDVLQVEAPQILCH